MNDRYTIAHKKRVVKDLPWHLEMYARSLKVNIWVNHNAPKGGIRGDIKSFSSKSKARLKFIAGNAFPELISHFCMTYHETYPQGREVKKQLDIFLKRLRRKWKCGYLWVLEFQTRGFPHIHTFLTLPIDTPGLREWLSKTWNEIVSPGDAEHLAFHAHEKNFIAWDMRGGGYLCKYLSKQAQKVVPENFEGVGRFWGSSRGLVPDATVITPEMIDENYPEKPSKAILRAIYRHHENQCKGYKRKSGKRNRGGRVTIPNGVVAFEKYVEYLDKNKKDEIPF